MCWDLQNEWLKSSKWTVAGPFIPLLFSVFTLHTALEFKRLEVILKLYCTVDGMFLIVTLTS